MRRRPHVCRAASPLLLLIDENALHLLAARKVFDDITDLALDSVARPRIAASVQPGALPASRVVWCAGFGKPAASLRGLLRGHHEQGCQLMGNPNQHGGFEDENAA